MNARERKLSGLKKKILSALGKEAADFGLHFINNSEMEALRQALIQRRDFRGAEARKIAKEEKVNVLAFPEPAGFPHPESRREWLGEVYLNAGMGRRAAHTPEFLLLHGVLHLLGYRHQKVRDTMKMKALEGKLCQKLGISDAT